MEITKIEALTKAKYRIEIDGQLTFVLYKGELSRYGLKEGGVFTEELYDRIKQEVLIKRAKLRAMHLLEDMARTESGLKRKLQQGGYPEEVVDEAMNYVHSFGYLNDVHYAESFVESKKGSKSRREIYALLCQKGISRDIADEALKNAYEEDGTEADAIRQIIRKRRVDPAHADEVQMQKLYGYLARKGFPYEEVRQVIQNYSENA